MKTNGHHHPSTEEAAEAPSRLVAFGKGAGMYGAIYLRELQSPTVQGLRKNTLLVLLLLYSMQDSKTGMVWPSQHLIRDTLGISMSSVTRAVRELEEAKLLEKVPGPGRSLRYRMLKVPTGTPHTRLSIVPLTGHE